MITRRRRGFTLVELAATVATIALALGVLLPAVSFARGQGRSTTSMDNLRTLSAAHFVYSVDWNDRQLTYIVDDASYYGDFRDWWDQYNRSQGSDGSWGHPANHPPITLGWGRLGGDGDARLFEYEPVISPNAGLLIPINWDAPGTIGVEYFGSFRFPNAQQFHQYLGGRFYDEVFYAPNDDVVIEIVEDGFALPDEYWDGANVSGVGSVPAWSSYCLSPASMFDPLVMRHDDPNEKGADGWRDPWNEIDSFRSPTLSQFTYPALKTHMLEHHWIQNAPFDRCNPGFGSQGTYGGCEPYYFNHGLASVPMTLFHDGHVEGVSVVRAMADDEAVRVMTGNDDWGLWSKDTPWGDDGYFSEYGYDQAETSFHILTTDGAEGRDVLAPGATSSTWRPRGARNRVKVPRRPAPGEAGAQMSRVLEPDP